MPQKPYSGKIKMVKTPIIWNITQNCFWNCSYCCISANENSQENPELSLKDKLRVVRNIDSKDVSMDVSGGDPLISQDNLEILKELSKTLGKENLSITTTGKGLGSVDLDLLVKVIGEVGFTYDFPYEPSPDRPLGYNSSNLTVIGYVIQREIRTLAQTPLTRNNISDEIIQKIYRDLNEVGVEKLLLMKFFEVGRGIERSDLTLTQKENKNAIKNYRSLERKYGSPKVRIIPSLRGKLFEKFFNSLNITNQGLLLSTPWAYNIDGEPYEGVILGDLKTKKLSELSGRNVYQRFLTQLKRNIRR